MIWLNGDRSFELQVIQGSLNHSLCLENAKLTSVGCGKRKPLAGFGFNCARTSLIGNMPSKQSDGTDRQRNLLSPSVSQFLNACRPY